MLKRMVAFPKEMMFEVENGEVDVLQMDKARKSNQSRKTSMCQSLVTSGYRNGPGKELSSAAGEGGSGQMGVRNGRQ